MPYASSPETRGCPPPPQQTDSFEYYATEHFRLSGVYWGLTGMALLGRLPEMEEAAFVAWLLSCQVRAQCHAKRSEGRSSNRQTLSERRSKLPVKEHLA